MAPLPKLPPEGSYQRPYAVALNDCLKGKQPKALDKYMGHRAGWIRSRTSGKYFSRAQELENILEWPVWSDEDRRRIRAGYEMSIRLRDEPRGQWKFDAIGIGALNYDHILTADGYRQWAERRGAPSQLVDLGDDAEVVVGSEAEIIDDLADIEDLVVHSYGGSSFNTIRLLATPALGVRVDFVGISGLPPRPSRVTDSRVVGIVDSDGRPLERHLERLKDLGLPCAFVDPVDEVGGRCNSRIVPDRDRGERRMCTWQGANGRLGAYIRTNRSALASHLATSQWIHVSSLIDTDSAREVVSLLSEVTNRQPVRVSFDPGELWCRTETPEVRELLALTSLLFVNAKELGLLVANYCGFVPQVHTTEQRTPEVLGLLQPESSVVVVKQQGRSLVASKRNAEITIESVLLDEPLSHVEDDTGAGDAFAAGYLASLFDSGLSRRAGALLGMQLAKAKVAIAGPPTEAAIAELVQRLRLDVDVSLPQGTNTGRLTIGLTSADPAFVSWMQESMKRSFDTAIRLRLIGDMSGSEDSMPEGELDGIFIDADSLGSEAAQSIALTAHHDSRAIGVVLISTFTEICNIHNGSNGWSAPFQYYWTLTKDARTRAREVQLGDLLVLLAAYHYSGGQLGHDKGHTANEIVKSLRSLPL